jgi:hypothetical protein
MFATRYDRDNGTHHHQHVGDDGACGGDGRQSHDLGAEIYHGREREGEREREVVRRLSGSWQRDCASPPSTCLGLRVAALGRMRESRGREREFETDGC